MTIEGASSTSSLTHWTYDVFISFRGEDTRKNFTDHLHDALKRNGINVFKDDKGLGKGKSIAPELSKAIETSRISIIVFSRNYASSTWCLDELVQIVRSRNEKKQIVIPIFYDVDPSMVRNQRENFQHAFVEHEMKNREKVQNWRNALKVVADLSGYHLKDRHEADFIQEIVKKIRELIFATLWTQKGLVGMESRLETPMKLLTSNTKSYDVEMIGIYGMGGIGKTTIARAICDSITHQFEGVSFLANVRKSSEGSAGLVQLQKQLLSQITGDKNIIIWDECNGMNMIRRMLSNKKVLIVVDDVDDRKQLRNLVGNHSWFGVGSRVVITTRDKHLLVVHWVDKLYEVEPLNHYDALELFCSKAFNNCQPSGEYLSFSNAVVNYVCGLPLALEVLGCFLVGRNQKEWESALERLHRDFDVDICCPLEISYKGLTETEKKIFLDIACFFKGKNKDHVTRILDGCGFSPDISIGVLVDKCLLKVSEDNKLWMHDLLQEMGQHIAQRDSIEERSRLWKKEDVLHVLAENTGTNKVEGIIFEEKEQLHVNVSAKVFLNMTKLRLLIIRNVQLSEGLECLSKELRLLDWHGYSSKSLSSSLRLDKLVVLQLQCSRIEQLWIKEVQPLNKLKVINLSHSKMFKKTPYFSKVPNLEELILEGCTKLCEIHSSLLVHKKLILLNMKDCTSLTTLPSEIGMESLKKFILSGCLKLKKFPDQILGSMECLAELYLDRTPFKELPLSIAFFKGLTLLSLKYCKNLVSLSSVINGLQSLKTLRLSGWPKLENFPENLQIESLEELDIRGTATREPMSNSWYSHFPFVSMLRGSSGPVTFKLPSLSSLISLKRLDLSYRNIEVIPNDIGSLTSLQSLNLEGNNFVSLPASINRLSKLQYLYLRGCKKLQSIVELPSNLKLKKFPDQILGSMECLAELYLDRTPFKELPLSIASFKGLILLSLKNCKNLVSLSSVINGLQSLETLNLSGCPKLEIFPEKIGSVEELDIRGTATREPMSNSRYSRFPFISMLRGSSGPLTLKLPSLSSLISLKELDLTYRNIEVIPSDIGSLAPLRSLALDGNNFVSLPASINHLSKLEDIQLKRCEKLQSIVELPSNLERVHVDDCISLETFSINAIKSDGLKVLGVGSGFKLFDYDEISKIISALNVKKEPEIEHVISISALGSEIPIYEEEFDQECSRSVSGNMIEFHQDSVGPNIDFATTNSKRSLTDYDGAATSTGSANSDDNEPQPKRHKSS